MSQASAQKPFDPYDLPPPWWQSHSEALAICGVFLAQVLLTVLSFPPFKSAEFAYAFAAPAVFWAYRRPAFRTFAFTVLGANALAWTLILNWLHHVTWAGLLLLGPLVGLWVGLWYLAVWWAMPRFLGKSVVERLLGLFALAGLWVLIEWSRTWFLSGFPWLPLAASQWQKLSILQIAAFTGAYGVSFVLVCMNIGFAAYGHRLLCEGQTGLRRRSQEFFACLFLLVVCVTIHVQETFNRGQFTSLVGRLALVQPDIAQEVKWDASKGPQILKALEESTLAAARLAPDLILWPEATTPWAVRGDERVKAWVEQLAAKTKKPLLLGSIAIERPSDKIEDELWYNGVFLVDPSKGLHPVYYAKQHLVPFGEFVPLRPLLGWLKKVVPVGDDFTPGTGPRPLLVPLQNQALPFGPLICYEDIFPNLAREASLAGAEILFVATNAAWYGKSGAAEQHASHSVLRAIENRRPVLRCGNNGWSGWIDEFGSIRDRIADKNGNLFIRANGAINMTRDARWIGQTSFYTRHGDWFVLLCAGLVALGYLLLRRPTSKGG